MRSPLELLAGKFEHALLTTYSFNLRFFEEWVLRALWASEVRNVVVFVDRRQLGSALADRAPSVAGRAFHVVSGSCARAAFHPKLLLVSGPEGSRLCVSSANLTADGQLRNAESAIAFDANLRGHRRPILEAGDLFRRLSEEAPPHTAEAIHAALGALPEAGEEEEESPYRLIHNLDAPLLDAFPERGRTRGVTPFADANGAAAARLHERGGLTVILAGDEFAAGPAFFAGPWTVEPRRFDARLHGKAYEVETAGRRWVLVGSPNLSAPALLATASEGNLEVAVAVADAAALELPPSKPWPEEDIAEAAVARQLAGRTELEPGEGDPTSFDAWEEEGRIAVSGVAEGARIEHWAGQRWKLLGTVADGAVLVSDPDLRPVRLRAVSGNRIALAVVARPATLKARMRSQARGRQTEAVERLPLDLEAVRVLEGVLAELFALSELAGEAVPPDSRLAAAERAGSAAAEPDYAEWMPRSPDDEPRVPPVYTRAWKGEPDALLGLVSRVLRLDLEESSAAEIDVGREALDLEDLDQVTSAKEVDVDAEEERPLSVGAGELQRYRRAFHQLFERGERFLASAADPTLAGWTFAYLLRLVEELGSRRVEVDGKQEPLMPQDDLRAVTLYLLERYFAREEPDLLCLASARAHLAAAIRDSRRCSRRDRERLEALAYTWAAELVAVPASVPAPRGEVLGLEAEAAIAQLEDYAHRSQWEGVLKQAREVLDDARLERLPWVVVAGSASWEDRTRSPAWSLLSFAAPVGYAASEPFGARVESEDSSADVHIVICVPVRKQIIEAWRRSRDGVWVERHYGAPTMGTVMNLTGPASLEPTMAATELEQLANPSEEVLAVIDSRVAGHRR